MLMRDITFGASQTRDLWRGEGAFDLLDRIYDQILVYGDRTVFDPILEYDLSSTAAAKTRFCGYLRPPSPTRSPSEVRAALGTDDRPLLVATVGGGADGSALLQTVLSALRDAGDDAPDAFVVTGPLLGAADRSAVAALAAELPRVTLLPFAPNLVDYLHAADVVVTMGGYNALCEVVAAGKRAVVVPRRPGPEEQLIRAERFRALGLVTLIHPDDLSPDALQAAIAAELHRGASPIRGLPFDGRERIVAELTAALASADTRA
jgi:predicted glycosyltransferase